MSSFPNVLTAASTTFLASSGFVTSPLTASIFSEGTPPSWSLTTTLSNFSWSISIKASEAPYLPNLTVAPPPRIPPAPESKEMLGIIVSVWKGYTLKSIWWRRLSWMKGLYYKAILSIFYGWQIPTNVAGCRRDLIKKTPNFLECQRKK